MSSNDDDPLLIGLIEDCRCPLPPLVSLRALLKSPVSLVRVNAYNSAVLRSVLKLEKLRAAKLAGHPDVLCYLLIPEGTYAIDTILVAKGAMLVEVAVSLVRGEKDGLE